VCGKHIQMIAHHADRQIALRRIFRKSLELQRQAFAQIARADAGLIQMLQLHQRGLKVIQRDVEFHGQ
jgi:hypothetical protein